MRHVFFPVGSTCWEDGVDACCVVVDRVDRGRDSFVVGKTVVTSGLGVDGSVVISGGRRGMCMATNWDG